MCCELQHHLVARGVSSNAGKRRDERNVRAVAPGRIEQVQQPVLRSKAVEQDTSRARSR